jgi:hypothetical protein
MRAFLVNPYDRRVSQLDFEGDYLEIRKTIGGHPFDAAYLNRPIEPHARLVCYVDDEGYYRDGQKWWRFAGYPNPLGGLGLILGVTDEGDEADAPAILSWVTAMVTFLDDRPELPHASVRSFSGAIRRDVDFNTPDAPKDVAETYERLFGAEPPPKDKQP